MEYAIYVSVIDSHGKVLRGTYSLGVRNLRIGVLVVACADCRPDNSDMDIGIVRASADEVFPVTVIAVAPL